MFAISLYLCQKTITYILHTDASYMGIGSVLSVSREGHKLPVAFFSRQLRSSEKNYTSSEIECLAVVDTIIQFEIHLVGKSFTLVTDHQALQYLASSRALNRRLTRTYKSSPLSLNTYQEN